MQLPDGLERRFEAICLGLASQADARAVDFSRPRGEEALVPPYSLSWRVFKNPVTVFIGGVAAVILELAEPAVRTGVWEYSKFREDPIGRLRRTGSAAMVTVYGARSISRPMIERVTRMHAGVRGVTPRGAPFSASDPLLLTWVHATAGYGFATAYSRFARELRATELDEYFQESIESAQLYGASQPPRSCVDLDRLFKAMAPRLERSSIVFEFLDIVRAVPALPRALLWVQRMLVRAAVEIVPTWARERLGLDAAHGLRPFETHLVKALAALAERIVLPGGAPAQSCVRLGLPAAYLYR
jgi:uncharacterized protein (DUF2236 family)